MIAAKDRLIVGMSRLMSSLCMLFIGLALGGCQSRLMVNRIE